MSYEQKSEQYEAVQLASGGQDAFLTALDFTHGDGGWAQGATIQALEHPDGSVSIACAAYPTFVVEVGDWMVSPGYWGTFTGWVGEIAPGNHYTNDQFTNRFSSI